MFETVKNADNLLNLEDIDEFKLELEEDELVTELVTEVETELPVTVINLKLSWKHLYSI